MPASGIQGPGVAGKPSTSSVSAGAAAAETTRFPRSRWALLRSLKITFAGLLALIVVILIGLAALNSEANLLFLLFSLSVGLVVFGAVVPLFMIRWIEVERVISRAAVAGRVLPVSYVVRNHGRWGAAWGLVIEETAAASFLHLPRGFVQELPAGGHERVELLAHCPRRGRYPLKGVRARSSFPLGLFSCEVVFPAEAEIVVYPALGSLRGNPWRDQRWADAQTSRQRRAGLAAEELDGLREYRDGDPLRLIHWRRSAHAGDLVVRDSPPAQPTQLILLLDPWPDSDFGGEGKPDRRRKRKASPVDPEQQDREVELIISAAATAACDALERGHRVGLIARGQVPVIIPPGSGRVQRQRVLHELTMLRAGSPEMLDELVSRIRWSSGWHARCLLCVSELNDQHRRLARFLSRRAEMVSMVAPGTAWFDSVFIPAPPIAPEASSERRGP
ncbi:MAG TPA: DUF58 domain-containing protein [Phycisphaerae bacterium]|nr:DUF58 domain-containing protein [Phycisphaerae bacterium]HRY71105.1 DUF58 domain-containing protein [Phycisphaerae bacterium]HSA29485.1 DUF58 domain-containing protein [Phycisphaerae bacterium]